MLEGVRSVEIETIRWETHAWPDIGEDAQDVINNEIGEFDILIGIMWRRFGSPTNRADSGTEEEFQRAYEFFKKYGRPKIMFYFRKTPFYTTNLKEITQFRKVIQFRKGLEKLGVLFWEFESSLQFERNVREHLIRQVLSLSVPEIIEPEPPAPVKPKKGPKPGISPAGKKDIKAVPIPAKLEKLNIFMAYVHEDQEQVTKVYHDLRIAGMNPWLDTQNLLPGQMWHSEVDKALKTSDIVIVFLSKHSVSKRSFFQKEIKSAIEILKTKKPEMTYVIPVRLDNTEVPLDLAQYQWVNYFHPEGIKNLLETLKVFSERQLTEQNNRYDRLISELRSFHPREWKKLYKTISKLSNKQQFFLWDLVLRAERYSQEKLIAKNNIANDEIAQMEDIGIISGSKAGNIKVTEPFFTYVLDATGQ